MGYMLHTDASTLKLAEKEVYLNHQVITNFVALKVT